MQTLRDADAQREGFHRVDGSAHPLVDAHAVGLHAHGAGDIEVFCTRRRLGVVLHDVGQQRGVGHAVRRVVEGSQRVSHRVDDAQPHIRKAHAGDILRLGHARTGRLVAAVVDGVFQVSRDQLDRLQFEHVAHRPRPRREVALDGVRQRIHTRGGGQPLGHRVHQFAVDHGAHRDVVGIDADHLALGLLVGDDVVDRHLGRRTRRRGDGEGRHGAVLGRRRPFERTHVGELGIVDDDPHGFGRVDRRAAAQRDHEVGARTLEGLDALLHVADRGVGLDLAVNLIGDARIGEHALDLFGHAETDQILVRDQQRLAEAALANLLGDHRAATRTVVGGFVQYDSVHGSIVWRLLRLRSAGRRR